MILTENKKFVLLDYLKNMQNQKTNIEQMYRGLLMIWAAIVMSQFLFLVVLYFIKPELFRFDFSAPLLPEGFEVLIGIFALVGISNVVISLILRKKYLAQATAEKNPAFVQTAMITGCALCEAVSLFGMMLALVAGYQYFFFWFILGIIATVFHFPRRDDLIAASYKGQ